jgi:hypothetical protein
LSCYSSLDVLPKTSDLVIYVISGLALETSFEAALKIEVGGVLIYASNYIVEDQHPRLTDRLKLKARAENIPVIGGNSMSFYDYDDLNNRLGCQVLVMQQVESTIELAIGMKYDNQYGPLIVIASEGIFIDILKDWQTALAPVNYQQATELLDKLMIAKLLDSARRRPDIDQMPNHDLIIRFSALVSEFCDVIGEVDMNSVLLNEYGCTIVDGRIIGRVGNDSG